MSSGASGTSDRALRVAEMQREMALREVEHQLVRANARVARCKQDVERTTAAHAQAIVDRDHYTPPLTMGPAELRRMAIEQRGLRSAVQNARQQLDLASRELGVAMQGQRQAKAALEQANREVEQVRKALDRIDARNKVIARRKAEDAADG